MLSFSSGAFGVALRLLLCVFLLFGSIAGVVVGVLMLLLLCFFMVVFDRFSRAAVQGSRRGVLSRLLLTHTCYGVTGYGVVGLRG